MSRLFRKSFLLSLRDEADDLTFVSPQRHVLLFWPTMFAVGFGLAALAAWLFTAQLTVTVETRGVVMLLGGMREVVSVGRGIVTVAPTIGQGPVKAGDLLLKLTDPSADAEYDSQRRSYLLEAALLATQEQAANRNFENKTKELSIRLDSARANLARLRTIAAGFEGATKEREETERTMLQTQQQAMAEVKQLYDGVQEGADHLVEKGLTSKRDYIALRQGKTSVLQTLSQISIEKARLTVEGHQLQREFSDIMKDLAEQSVEEQSALGTMDETRSKLKSDIESLKLQAQNSRNKLLDVEQKLWMNANILVPYDGELTAIKKGLGQPVSQGESVALVSMTPQDPKSLLVISQRAKRGHLTLAYKGQKERIELAGDGEDLPVRIQDALHRLVPNVAFSARRNGEGITIAASKSQMEVLRQLELAEAELVDGEGVPTFAMLFPLGDDWTARELDVVVLLRPEDSKRVKVGDHALVKPDFEKSLIGAQIEARVSQVNSFVATSIEAQSLVGSAEVSRSLGVNQQGMLQGVAAVLQLERDSSGELRIHGESLARPLTAGSTGTVHIQVDEATPIAVLLPFYIDLFR